MNEYKIQKFNFLVKYITDYEKLEKGFAGKCADINHKFLSEAKKIFGNGITLALGWIEISGVEVFRANGLRETKFHDYDATPRYDYHVWLEKDGKIIDLTLIDTLRDKSDFDDSIIPKELHYVTTDTAKDFNISYHTEKLGDKILESYKL